MDIMWVGPSMFIRLTGKWSDIGKKCEILSVNSLLFNIMILASISIVDLLNQILRIR